jgi:glyoxylase-like metal-dependent hydrolase (beta-lactamase superfamily II)
MPDQSSAANEHAILEEITAPLASLPDDPVADAAAVDFPIVLRGYDRIAVDAYVRKTSQLLAELTARHSPDSAVRRALERLGDQVSGILQRAHETAADITAQSRAEAEDRLEVARGEAEQIKAAAQDKMRELDADVDRIWAERDRIVADALKLAEELRALGSDAAARFPPAEEPAGIETDLSTAERPATVEQATGYLAGEEPPVTAARPVPAVPFDGDSVGFDSHRTVVLPLAATRVIDLLHLGRERVIGCWQVGDVLIDPGPASCIDTLLDALGDQQPRALLLTHVHLDHAGASGSLVEIWPELEIYVHERGAAHLAEPARLLESARRLYGRDMDRLWGEFLPVPASNLRVLRGDETVLGQFEVAYTPGHASHHISYLHEGTAFVGDVGGVRVVPNGITIPPTPPPDIDVEAWHASLQRVAAWQPDRLAMTHFGESSDVDAQLAEVGRRLDAWAELARTHDQKGFIEAIQAEIAAHAGPAIAATYQQAAAPDQLYAGLDRYWRKRDSAASAAQAPQLS